VGFRSQGREVKPPKMRPIALGPILTAIDHAKVIESLELIGAHIVAGLTVLEKGISIARQRSLLGPLQLGDYLLRKAGATCAEA
jgi:hypothetical protein